MTFLITNSITVSATTAQAPAKPVDIIVIVEDTVVIQQFDPDQVRKTATRDFLSMLDDTDRAAVISFGSNGHPLTDLLEMNSEKNVDQLFSAIDKLAGKGKHGHLPEALTAAKQVIEKNTPSNNHEMHVVLLTYGETGIDNTQNERQAFEEQLTQLLLWFKTNYVPVHVITAGDASEETILKNITSTTNGSLIQNKTPDHLISALRDLYGVIRNEATYNVVNGSFKIDNSIKQFKLLAIPGRQTMKLSTPTGDSLTIKNHNTHSLWRSTKHFTAVSVKEPETGVWRISSNTVTDSNVTLHFTKALNIHYQLEQDNIKAGDKIKVSAWLESDDQIITDSSIIQFVQVRLKIMQDGNIIDNVSLFPEKNITGRFFTDIKLEQAGEYRFQISMEDNNLYREAVFTQNVIPQQISPQNQAPDKTSSTARTTAANTTEVTEATKTIKHATDHTPAGFQANLKKKFPHLEQALEIATSINGILIIIGGLFYYRRRMQQQTVHTFDFVKSSMDKSEPKKTVNFKNAAA